MQLLHRTTPKNSHKKVMCSSQQPVGGFNPFGKYWLLVQLYHLRRDLALKKMNIFGTTSQPFTILASTIYMDAYTNHFLPPNNSHLSIYHGWLKNGP